MAAYANIALLLTAIPFALWATWADLRYMKIPNGLVLSMAISFLVIGAVSLPMDVYLWRIAGGILVLVVGFALFSLNLMGGGDAKFAAAMALFVAHGDILQFLLILSLVTLLAVVLHWLFGKPKFMRPITQKWESWANKQKFPMGFGMGTALILYLATRPLM